MNKRLHTVGIYINEKKEIINLIYNPFGIAEKINSVLEITEQELNKIQNTSNYKSTLKEISEKYLN